MTAPRSPGAAGWAPGRRPPRRGRGAPARPRRAPRRAQPAAGRVAGISAASAFPQARHDLRWYGFANLRLIGHGGVAVLLGGLPLPLAFRLQLAAGRQDVPPARPADRAGIA